MKYIFVAIVFFALFETANAQVIINEIMYDLEGSDTKREWIEIYNNSSNQIDLTDWKFNDGSNHILNIPPEKGGQGSIIIQPYNYAILASDAVTFLSEHSSFSGTIIDTVMSLNNTQDTLALIDLGGVTVDSVTYTSDLGAIGDGNSLQLILESWKALSPTQGIVNFTSDDSDNILETDENENQESSSSSVGSQSSSFSTEPQIFADAGKDKSVAVGADTLFEGKSFGLKKEPLINAQYIWNFGNGEIKKGQNVLHYYQYPGEYAVILNVSSGVYSASDRIIVNAYPAELVISNIDENFIEIHNKSNRELNLSWWQIQSQNNRFIIPRDTIILPNRKLIFSSETIGFNFNKENTSLLYPNGVNAFVFEEIKIPQKNITTIQTKTVSEETQSPQHQPATTEENNILQESQEEEKQDKEFQKDMSQTASVISSLSGEDKDGGIYKWLAAIFGIVGISVGVIIFISDKKGINKKDISDEIEIID
ncbi:hypothetical protein COT82_01855 [Candidatus Campbellbacteria bacterium CG10_big_fil_rev_8_21_14_0_10_35_52]|uniref:PKD domain-containing protein n=1 Tax=Candidatus Campbellbacteria bacterium CG10_big_fil_rev_8_21_14_0_10_35_52 TaxID=1974527 RepID=A0A2M6WV73_9BACT|nr:MAG: hypothetical protein COT82_01855 [Candidatus Campbellbacteria bacterium CG10_big_fil_rev_8_21_14_0_10_35_52]